MSSFLLKLKKGRSWPPKTLPETVSTVSSSSNPIHKPPEVAKDKKPEPSTSSSSLAVPKCHAFLEVFNPKASKKSTHSSVGNYAVIGRGFAATVNLSTLRTPTGKTRVHRSGRGRHLVLIGYPDPWQSYVRHNMNQEVELLTLPGYEHRPDLPGESSEPRWLDSRRFASHNAQELERHLTSPTGGNGSETFFKSHTVISDGVTHVTPEPSVHPGNHGDGFCRFRIHLQSGETIVASKVDICTGTGQQRLLQPVGNRAMRMPSTLWEEYFDPQGTRTGRAARVWAAEMYVTGDKQFKTGGTVLIGSAGSPAGIQAGEHALGLDGGNSGESAAEVVMMASAKINAGLPPIGRLDALARTDDGPLPMRLATHASVNLSPTDPRLWFAENGSIVSVDVLSAVHLENFEHDNGKGIDKSGVGEKLFVTFKLTEEPRLVQGVPLDASTKPTACSDRLEYGLFDQVVFNTGRDAGKEAPGSALSMVEAFAGELTPIPGYGLNGFPVGVHNANGRLRILGAAGINNTVYKLSKATEGGKNPKNFEKYEDSLPWQARVNGEGVTLAALTIAMANGYWEGGHNTCINTATIDDLKAQFGEQTATTIYKTRHWRVRPFTSLEDVFLACEYWSYYFDRRDLTELVMERSKRNDSKQNTELTDIRYMVQAINDLTLLRNWRERAKERGETPGQEPFGMAALTSPRPPTTIRYADHINDPATRAKILADTP